LGKHGGRTCVPSPFRHLGSSSEREAFSFSFTQRM
jgi:hypothetical protein